jgi:hypothetical protein
MKIIPFEMKHFDEMKLRNFDYNNFEQQIKILSLQASISETWTFVMDDIKCCITGLIHNKSNNTVSIWMFVDDIITSTTESKKKFISLCDGMERYIVSKFYGNTLVATLIDHGIDDYHNFPKHFGFEATSNIGKLGTVYQRDI